MVLGQSVFVGLLDCVFSRLWESFSLEKRNSEIIQIFRRFSDPAGTLFLYESIVSIQ